MNEVFIQLLTATIGTLGFALIFNLPKRYMFFSCLGGLLSWAAFLLFSQWIESLFLTALIASFIAGIYAELMAGFLKAPSTLFLITAVIPLIPGSSLYYTMNAAVSANSAAFSLYSSRTTEYALGIAIGISVALMFAGVLRSRKKAIHNA